jgi:predicted RND superfamily exporter protein
MKRISQLVILSIIVLSGFFAYELRNLAFDYDYEKYFPKENKQMETFVEFRENYGSDSDFLLIGLEKGDGILDIDFLKQVKYLGDSLRNHPLINFIFSPVHNAKYIKDSGFSGLLAKDYLDLNKDEISKKDSLNLFSNPNFIGSILPENGKSLCLFIQTEEQLSKLQANSLLDYINTQLNKYDFEKVHKSGRLIAQTHYVETMLMELVIFISASVFLLIFFLYISFRTLWGVVIPLFVVIISNIWTMAVMYYTGKSFDLLMMMLPTIIFVVGMSDLVHLLTKYLEELRKGINKTEALKISFKEVRWATFLTSFTTAIGFFTLLSSNVQPIQEFGLYAGIGVFVSYLLAFTLLPAVLYLSDPPIKILKNKQGLIWDNILHKLFLWVLKSKRKIIIGVILLGVIGVYSMQQIQVNNYLLEDLSDSDPVKKDVMFFENNYSGIRPFEMTLKTKDANGLLTYNVALEIEKVQTYLKAKYTPNGVGFLMSPLTVIKEVNFVKHRSKSKYRRFPKSERRFNAIVKQLKEWGAKEFGSLAPLAMKFIHENGNSGRIAGKINDIGGLAIKAENRKLDDFILKNINPDLLEIELTGTALLIDENNSYLALNLLKGLLIAFMIIGCIVGFMFKSIKLAFLTLIPNILPLLMVTFVMWIGGIDLKISTSLIFTLAFGIAVDDTIHLLAKYKLEIKKGKSHSLALKRSYLSSGKAIIVTTLILVGGFLTLLFSSFASTFYMGLLVSITLIFAVTLDLLIMPIIILYSGK